MYRLMIGPVLGLLMLLLIPSQESRCEETKNWLSPDLLKKGLNLIPKISPLSLNVTLIDGNIDFRPTVNLDFRADVRPLNLFGPIGSITGRSKSDLEELENRRNEFTTRLEGERNSIEREKLVVLKRQLDVQIEQVKLVREHLDQEERVFEYQKKRDESLLRRLEYSLRPDKLIVIVADFSDGGTGEGVQVADEIANALTELRRVCKIDFEVLVGEIKPGIVIRNEHMARDIGQHLPKGSCYAVVWGTLSPRTVGKFRPHVTCVMKTSADQGVSSTYTVDLASQDLPPNQGDEAARRAWHAELVAFTCAVVPGCYASYELSQERNPDLEELYKYLKKDSPEADRFQKSLAPLQKWPNARNGKEKKFEYLTRISKVGQGAVTVNGKIVTADIEYPQVVLNRHDNSVMTLITEEGSYKPRLFDDPGGKGKYIAYIDTTETTWRQFIPIYNGMGPEERSPGGQPLMKFQKERTNVVLGADENPPDGKLTVIAQPDWDRPVFNITYHGALAYCRKTGKELPRKEEWQAAASRIGKKYPWGELFGDAEKVCVNKTSSAKWLFPTSQVGDFAMFDRSGIGCVDMAGNVAEWCEDVADEKEATRIVCGGSWNDVDPKAFEITYTRQLHQSKHYTYVGFRGIVRIPVP